MNLIQIQRGSVGSSEGPRRPQSFSPPPRCARSVLEPLDTIGFYGLEAAPSHSAIVANGGRLCPMMACSLAPSVRLKIP